MELFQLVLAILTAFASIGGGVVYWLKKRSDGKYLELESRLKTAATKADSELEKIKADTAQALSASESIKSLTGAVVAQVEERRESTVATKENTVATKENVEALKTMSVSIDSMSKGRDDGIAILTTAITTMTTLLTENLSALVKEAGATTEALTQVATGQDDMQVLFEALALVVHRLKFDNKRFAEFILRPTDASKQGIEDIATGKHDEPNALPATAAVTA